GLRLLHFESGDPSVDGLHLGFLIGDAAFRFVLAVAGFGDFLIELRNKRVHTGTGNITSEEVSEDETHNEGGDCKHVRRHLVGLFAEYTLRNSTFCRKFAAFSVTGVRVRICFNAAALQAADGTDRLETSGPRASHRGGGLS